MLLLYFLGLGLIVGRLAGGRLDGLETVRFRWWPLALGGLTFQVLLFGPLLGAHVGDLIPALYVVSTLVVLGALLLNVSQPGFRIITLGAVLNLLAIVANGGLMPSSPDARLALNGSLDTGHAWTNSMLGDGGTHFAFLGDIFVLPRPIPFANVFSIGDVLIGLGAMYFIVAAMRRGADRRRKADRQALVASR